MGKFGRRVGLDAERHGTPHPRVADLLPMGEGDGVEGFLSLLAIYLSLKH